MSANTIPEQVKLQFYLAMPEARLERLASSFGMARKAKTHSERAEVLSHEADMVIRTFVNSHLYFLEPPEAKSMAKKLKIGQGLRDTEELAWQIECFLEHDVADTAPEATSAADGVTFATLCEESERMALPTTHLQALDHPQKSQPRTGIWYLTRPQHKGQELWLTVDLRRHPDDKLKADGILHVYAEWGQERGTAIFESRRLPRTGADQVSLHAVEEWDFPSTDILMTKAKGKVRKWREEIGWQPGMADDPVLEEYETDWGATHPIQQFHGGNVYAQLGGWPITWAEENAVEQVRRKLVLRTYDQSEPWLEVFQRGKSYEVISRIT